MTNALHLASCGTTRWRQFRSSDDAFIQKRYVECLFGIQGADIERCPTVNDLPLFDDISFGSGEPSVGWPETLRKRAYSYLRIRHKNHSRAVRMLVLRDGMCEVSPAEGLPALIKWIDTKLEKI